MSKTCNVCNESKPETEFYARRLQCKTCMMARKKVRRDTREVRLTFDVGAYLQRWGRPDGFTEVQG